MGQRLTSADPEPPWGTIVCTDGGVKWRRYDEEPGVANWLPEMAAPDYSPNPDPESWVKVAGNYGPVTVVDVSLTEYRDHAARPFEELRDSGVLWLINRMVFHPQGYALALHFDSAYQLTGWSIAGNGTEEWRYTQGDDRAGFEAMARTWRDLA